MADQPHGIPAGLSSVDLHPQNAIRAGQSGVLRSWPATTAPSSRIASILPPGQLLAGLEVGSALALSPDGDRLAYVARQDGVQRLYLRLLSGLESQPVAGSEGAFEPFFSPDGRWVAFFAGGKLRKASVSTGESLILADAQGSTRRQLGQQRKHRLCADQGNRVPGGVGGRGQLPKP